MSHSDAYAKNASRDMNKLKKKLASEVTCAHTSDVTQEDEGKKDKQYEESLG
jgi:hypothetical protein